MKRLFVVFALLMLPGCAQKVYVPVPYYVLPEDGWLSDVPVVTPPDKAKFMAADQDARLSMCMGAYVDQLEQITLKNKDMKAARTWKAEKQVESESTKK